MRFICELWSSLESSDKIQIIIALITFLGIIVSIIIAIVTALQNSKMIRESSRANIVFYIDYHPQRDTYFLVIKNFGNSIGKLLNIEILPILDWTKTNFNQELNPLTASKNVTLAPNQKISSWFDFRDYPDTVFKVKVSYKTLGKKYTEEYTINLDYIKNLDWLHSYAFDDTSSDYKEALYKINNSILEISDRLE